MSLSPEQIELRKKGMTATDVVALFPEFAPPYWKRRIEIYMEKLNLSEPIEDNPRMKAGRRFEEAIAQEFSEQKGLTIYEPNKTFVKNEWMMATPDRVVQIDPTDVLYTNGLECKNVSEQQAYMWGKPDVGGEPPYHVIIQCAWSMAVLGFDKWWVACCVGGWDFRFYLLERNLKFEETLIASARHFLFDIVRKQAWSEGIPPDDSEAYGKFIKLMYPRVEVERVTASEGMEKSYGEIVRLDNEISEMKSIREEHRNWVMKEMGSAGLAVDAREARPLFRFSERGGYTVKAHDVKASRSLTIIKQKGYQ